MSAPTQQQRRARLAADPDITARLAARLASLAGPDWQSARYGVAVSGGGDSMALLHLMHRLLPGQVAAATVDHGLRPEAADEAQMVAEYCARHSIAHTTLHPATPIQGSLQAAARAERYRLLNEWQAREGIDYLLTAHHADDQAETLIMRLNRGSGVAGLAGIRSRTGSLLRPLLNWRRAELSDWIARHEIPFVDDPSNTDPRFDRARLRRNMAQQDFIDVVAAAKSGEWLADADTALHWAVDQAIAAWPDSDDPTVIRDHSYPTEIFRRIIARRLQSFDASLALRGAALDGLIAGMRGGQRVMIGDLIINPASKSDTTAWRISPAPRRKASPKG